MEAHKFLEMRGISKKYGENQVLKNVSLSVGGGEIHALLGENGAGKSTLMNILFGMPNIHNTGGYEGEILVNGTPVVVDSPLHAMELGIGMVHQEFMLVPGFTIAENIKINREPIKTAGLSGLSARFPGKKLGLLDLDRMADDTREAMDRVGMRVDPQSVVRDLPVGYKQFVEIAREIDKKQVRLLVFDEPTAVLTESEAEVLLGVMRRLAAGGISIIFITHRLDEVMEVCENVTILRDGEEIAHMPTAETSPVQLAELMVGRKMAQLAQRDKGDGTPKEPLLTLRDFSVDMPGERTRGVDLTVYRGEILGIGGLGGQGKLSIANGIMGICPTAGEMIFEGESISHPTPKGALERGCAFVTEDRRGSGLLLDSSIEYNIAVTAVRMRRGFLRRYGLFTQKDQKVIRRHAEEMISTLDIRCTGPSQHVRRLSGGNQQKVCVARALTLSPKLLLVSEPTRGIDIGAKRLLLQYFVRLNQEQGVTVIITSSELAELRSICDRIAIISGGKIEGILPPDAPDSDYGLAMSGMYQDSLEKGEGAL